jgi:copper homeostasis protein
MPPNNRATLEVCIDDIAGLKTCQGRVDRIELCSALGVGGLTPSHGLIDAARTSSAPVHAMIRPRVGSFDHTIEDIKTALADIAAVKRAGLAGIVIGATDGDTLDLDALGRMKDAAGGLDCTLHRAIDLLADPITAMEQVIDLGFVRILTSGGTPKAIDGLDRLAALHTAAAGRIEIMVGSGVTKDNAGQIASATGIRSFHASCSAEIVPTPAEVAFGFAPTSMRNTSAVEIDAMNQTLAAI